MSYYANTRYQTTGNDSSGQIISGLSIVILIFVTAFTSEVLYVSMTNARQRFQTVLDYTADSQDSTVTIHQDATKYPGAVPIALSSNERTGIEFSYSFFLYVLPATFDGSATFKHVFHKGFAFPWPLMGPGVLLNGADNTMRVVMNTYKNPYTYVDIKNIPVKKWLHVVLNCIHNGLDVFVNGELANRITFTGTLPYQNFQDIVLFSQVNSRVISGTTGPQVLNGDSMILSGSFTGNLSNLIYARYALSVPEIQNLMKRGPSAKMNAKVMEQPPYLADDWWAHQTL